MINKLVICCAVLLNISACTSTSEQIVDDLARQTAKDVVRPIVEDNIPGGQATVVTDCVIDNASASEIISIAGAAVTGVTQSTVETVLKIVQRRDTVDCIAKAGLGQIFGGT